MTASQSEDDGESVRLSKKPSPEVRGGGEVMREGLRRAAEEADQPLEEHLRRSGVGILRDYDGQPDFFS